MDQQFTSALESFRSVWPGNLTGSRGSLFNNPDLISFMEGRDVEMLLDMPGSPGNLPIEVLLLIFEPLGKNDWKSVRCTCKIFAQLVSPRLFDKIFISPHKQNLDVFRQITEHSDLSRYPRELVYDVQEFYWDMDWDSYFKGLCSQLEPRTSCFFCSSSANAEKNQHVEHGILTDPLLESTQYVDHEVDELMRPIKFKYPGSRNYRVIQKGLKIYKQMAREQDYCNRSGHFLECLCIGLAKLPYLDKVEFQSTWDYLDHQSVDWSGSPQDLRSSPSPLARGWSPLHLRPQAASYSAYPFPPYSFPSSFSTHVRQLDNVIKAFSSTGKPLRFLDAGTVIRVPYEMFHTNSLLSNSFRQHGPAVTNGLECLTLEISMHRNQKEFRNILGPMRNAKILREGPPGKILSVDLLATTILHMPRLEYLSLSGVGPWNARNPRLQISELFQNARLPALKTLTLIGMSGSAASLLAFLREQPRLRQLNLSQIDLIEGTWADLVDEMRTWLHLGSVGLELPLRQGEVEDSSDQLVDLGDDYDWRMLDMTDKIDQYVLHGGENPLRSPEWIAAALQYSSL